VAAVSTEAQAADDKSSIDVQLAECRQLCETRGWQVAREIVIPGHSRDYVWLHEIIRDCPQYAELVSAIEAGSADLVVVRHSDILSPLKRGGSYEELEVVVC